jgi:hypothetical protein
MRVGIRRGLPKDVDWLLSQLRSFAQFFGSKRSLFLSEEHSRKVMLDLIENHVLFVAENESEESLGFIAGHVVSHPFNPEIRVLQETFWWVPEEYRGSRAGYLLLRHFVDWGKSTCDWLIMTLEHKSPVSSRVLERHGFKIQEHNYLLEVS